MCGCLLLCLAMSTCSRAPVSVVVAAEPARVSAQPSPERKVVRIAGLVQALESQSIQVPQVSGTGGRMTLTRLAPNGSKASKGDIVAEFDRVAILDEERDTKAKVDDLSHQWEEKKAQVNSDAAKRVAQLREAEADLEKAQLQLRKGPVLSEIDRLKNESKAENAHLRLASLKKSDEIRRRAEAAAVKTLELKRQRQQVSLERIQSNLERLQIRAPLDGMVVLENTWRNGSMGPAQAGDQMWPGMPILRIFNPSRMVVVASVDEPDIAWLWKSPNARLYLDAYPGTVFETKLDSANPVATAGMDSPVRSFMATFRIEQQSPLLLPDLSAALEIGSGASAEKARP